MKKGRGTDMPFRIIRNDITKVEADAIVNTANPHPRIGSGTDSAVYEAAGAESLLAERVKIGDIPVGKAAVTSAFALPARFIIHTVGPVWVDGSHGEEAALSSCYQECLKLARSLSCESIAFPLISSGNYGFPKDLAIRTATSVIYDFLMDNDMTVFLVVFDRTSYDLSGKLFQDIRSYIDENYVSDKVCEEYGRLSESPRTAEDRETQIAEDRAARISEDQAVYAVHKKRADREPRTFGLPAMPAAGGFGSSVSEHLKNTGMSFQEYLLQLIIERDMKNSDVYHGANISKQHFSKIISNRNYRPTKNTACALAISLHLDLETTNALLEKAGMILSRSSRFDLAVEYFILHKMYNIVNDNIILDENDLELLGTQ